MSWSVARIAVVAALMLGAPASARADEAEPVAWRAPAGCPTAFELRARVEARLGAPLASGSVRVTIVVRRTRQQLVARLTIAAEPLRTLTSRDCDQLADAVALIVARRERERLAAAAPVDELGSEAPAVARVATAPEGSSPAHVDPTLLAATPESRPVAGALPRVHGRARAADPTRERWGRGVRLLAVSGVGALPGIGIAGELAAYARRDETFVELALVRWARSAQYGGTAAPGNVELGLDTLAVRVGWVPPHTLVRGWFAVEGGRRTGTGTLNTEPMASRAWFALGAGAAVAWPMADRARLVGMFEVMVPLARAPYELSDGRELHQPALGAARCSLGLELGWW